MYDHTFTGLDVHAASVVGCALVPETGEIVWMQMDSDPAVVLEWIRRFEAPVKAVYESGPTGYVLARYLREAGIDCVVAASSKLLRAPADKIKTDKRDARITAEMLALGQVTEVRVPTREQEDLRDLSRLRATLEHQAWLHRQRFDSPVLQFAYEADVEQAELLAARLKRIDKQVVATAKACEYTPVVDALMCLRGIEVTTGFGLAVEIGDWTRFTGSSIGSYVGLVPSEQSSGQSRHQGPITKAGSKYARKLLIEAAWQHKRPYSRPGLRLLRQLDLVAPTTLIRALEGNHRLHHKWVVFDARKKRSVTANTAIARELGGWCWSLAAPLQQSEHGQGGHMNAA